MIVGGIVVPGPMLRAGVPTGTGSSDGSSARPLGQLFSALRAEDLSGARRAYSALATGLPGPETDTADDRLARSWLDEVGAGLLAGELPRARFALDALVSTLGRTSTSATKPTTPRLAPALVDGLIRDVQTTNPSGLSAFGTSAPLVEPEAEQTDTETQAAFDALFDGTESDDPATLLHEIVGDGLNGYWRWKIKRLIREIAERVMAEQGLTREGLATLPPEERAQKQRAVLEEVARRLRDALRQEGMAEATAGARGGAAVRALLDSLG